MLVLDFVLASDTKSALKEAIAAHERGDYVKVFKYYKPACDAGDAVSCHNLAALYEDGQGAKQDCD